MEKLLKDYLKGMEAEIEAKFEGVNDIEDEREIEQEIVLAALRVAHGKFSYKLNWTSCSFLKKDWLMLFKVEFAVSLDESDAKEIKETVRKFLKHFGIQKEEIEVEVISHHQIELIITDKFLYEEYGEG